MGGSSSVASIASAVVGILIAAGFEVPGMLPIAIDLIGGITGLTAAIMKGSSSHGLKVTLKSYMKTLHHGHETSQQEVWRITAISKY